MRLKNKQVITNHELVQNIEEDTHHNRGISATILINAQTISALSSWEYRIDLGKTGYKTLRVLLRGALAVDIQGHAGVFVISGNATLESSGIGLLPYGSGGYTTSYMGSYSRIHGDSWLAPIGMFGLGITLRDAYIDDDEAVLEFYNYSGLSQTLKCYGTLVIK
jgi:hypothetical protein